MSLKKKGEEVLQVLEQRSFPMKTKVRQAIPLQPMEIHSGADIHLQSLNDLTLGWVDAQRRL